MVELYNKHQVKKKIEFVGLASPPLDGGNLDRGGSFHLIVSLLEAACLFLTDTNFNKHVKFTTNIL